jgi:CubicO group peptidase (beta-lactamase class C family)
MNFKNPIRSRLLLVIFAASLLGLGLLAVEKMEIGPNVFSSESDFGIAMFSVRNGVTLASRFQGYEERSSKLLVSERTTFNIASLSKQFTAALVILLRREGKISLETSITQYLPELPNEFSAIKVKHLIYHTSGLPEYLGLCSGSKEVRNQDVIDFVKNHSEKIVSGNKFQYSNTGYVLLSEILQRVSKIQFPELLRTRIFKPLNMLESHVRTSVVQVLIPHQATGYGGWPFFPKLDDVACDTVFGDGGIYTSLHDYKHWLLALGSPGFFTADELQEIFSRGQLDDGTSIPYGFGWSLLEKEGRLIAMHSGAWTGFRSAVYYRPDLNLWIVVLSNSACISAWDEAKKALRLFQ